MSLIPSESYTFPDHFTTTVTPSRKPKEKKAPVELKVVAPVEEIISSDEEPIQKRRRRSLSSLLKRSGRRPDLVPAREPETAAEAPSPPKPVLRVEVMKPAQPPKIAQVNPQPAPNVIPMQVAPAPQAQPAAPQIVAAPAPVLRPQPQPQPRPARAVTPRMPRLDPPPTAPVRAQPIDLSRQPDFFERFAQNNDQTQLKRRRKMKMRRFIAWEGVAVGLLLPLAFVGLTRQVTMPALVWIVNILTIAAAAAAAVIPIAFFAFTPTLPEIDR